MRDHFYKAGAETIGILIDKHPYILQKILLFIDRNLDSLDEVSNFSLIVALIFSSALIIGTFRTEKNSSIIFLFNIIQRSFENPFNPNSVNHQSFFCLKLLNTVQR